MAWTAPKTNWAVGELVTAEDMNAIGENFVALKKPATAMGVTTENITGSNDDFADVDGDNLNLTITCTGGDVMIHFHGTVYQGGRQTAVFDVDIDGTRLGGDDGVLQSNTLAHHGGYALAAVSFTRLIQSLGAGSHTFKLQWKKKGGQPILRPGAQFWVREI